MKLYVARHGESEANHIGIMAGSEDDSPLTEQGWKDAAVLATKMAGFKGLIVTTPLHRAQQTAEYVRDQLLPGAPIRVDANFVERDMGNATDRPRDEYLSMERSGLPIACAETPEHMFARVKQGLGTIQQAGQDTLLVAHGVTYCMIVCVVKHIPPQEYAQTPIPRNGEVHVFEL